MSLCYYILHKGNGTFYFLIIFILKNLVTTYMTNLLVVLKWDIPGKENYISPSYKFNVKS